MKQNKERGLAGRGRDGDDVEANDCYPAIPKNANAAPANDGLTLVRLPESTTQFA